MASNVASTNTNKTQEPNTALTTTIALASLAVILLAGAVVGSTQNTEFKSRFQTPGAKTVKDRLLPEMPLRKCLISQFSVPKRKFHLAQSCGTKTKLVVENRA